MTKYFLPILVKTLSMDVVKRNHERILITGDRFSEETCAMVCRQLRSRLPRAIASGRKKE